MTTGFGTLVLSWQQLSFARLRAIGFFKIVRCLKSVDSNESFSGAHLSSQYQWMRGEGGGGGGCKQLTKEILHHLIHNPFKDFSSCMIYDFVLKMNNSIFQTSF